ncbi:MAG: threonine synthase [Rhodothermales bacterium]
MSTRGTSAAVSFEQALLSGLAPDGGLYVPDQIPASRPIEWQAASRFPDLASRVLAPWLHAEVQGEALNAVLEDALSFPVPLVPLVGTGWQGVYVLELFHGPTLSFKDFGARTMARLMAHFLKGRDATLTILVATSGDTGSAVADGFAGQEGIRVVLLYPKGQVSPVQERQLIVARPGVRSYAVEGTFDDCQRMVKAAFLDDDLFELRLSSANSINIGRLLPQMLYYVWAMQQGRFDEVVMCVPSGNLGNLTAGVMAALSGLPVRRFLAAHNANDSFPRFLTTGVENFGPSIQTLANAMDVGAPSNFERLKVLLGEQRLRSWVTGDCVSDPETIRSMRRVYDETGYVADPHTAVGMEAVRRYRAATKEQVPVVVLATAHPSKFPETVEKALGSRPDAPNRLAALWQRETQVAVLPSEIDAFKNRLLANA